MTPKEKAKELVDKFYPRATSYASDRKNQIENAKQCALIAVDEILKYVAKFEYGQGEKTTTYTYDYLQEVKQEINLLCSRY